MKKTHLSFGLLPKMNGRNSRTQFAAYRSDGKTQEQLDAIAEKEFLDSIKDLDEAGQATVKAARAQFKAIKAEMEASMISKEDAEELASKAVENSSKELKAIIEDLKTKTIKLGTIVTNMKNNGGQEPATKVEQIALSIKENKSELVEIAKGVSSKEITLKANTTRSSIATTVESHVIAGIGQLGRIARSLYDVATKLIIGDSNNQGIVSYVDWDEDTVVKAAAMVAEGGTFPESTAAFKGYTLPLRKVGDTLPVTEEFFEDEALCASELEMFIENNVDSIIDDQIVNGDGTGQELTGLMASVSEHTATSLAIPGANIYDLGTKMETAITSTRGSKYKPNFWAMNKNTIDRLILNKDANENYQFPPNHPIYSRIVEDNNIADNQMVVGDGRYMRIYEKPGVVISKGTVNAQFNSDLSTLKARKRLLFLIRHVDATGFLKCTDIDAALAVMEGAAMV